MSRRTALACLGVASVAAPPEHWGDDAKARFNDGKEAALAEIRTLIAAPIDSTDIQNQLDDYDKTYCGGMGGGSKAFLLRFLRWQAGDTTP